MVEESDLKSHLSAITSVLKIMGVWPENLEYKSYNLYTFYLIFNLIWICITVTLPLIVHLIQVRDDLEAFADCLFLTTSVIGGVIKMCLLVKNLPRIKIIMDCLDGGLYQPRNERQQSLMMELFKIWSFIFWFMFICTNSTMVFLIISPLMDSSNGRNLPSLAWYPVDYQQSPYYEILFMNQTLWFQYMAVINCYLDGLFTIIMVYIANQCKLLCDNLRNIEEFNREYLNRCNYETSDEHNTLKTLVSHHRGILMMSKEANMIFNISVAYQMCTSVLAICMTMFRLSIVEPLTGEFFASIFYQIALFLEILLYCWSGNEVISTSNEISLAGYEADWADSSIEFKRNLLFFMCGTQKPIRLYALKFFTLSLETFIKILRMSWSYFALLQEMNNANK